MSWKKELDLSPKDPDLEVETPEAKAAFAPAILKAYTLC